MSVPVETNSYAARLAHNLATHGLLDEPWKQAFTHTPRHLFLSDFYQRTNGAWELITPDTIGKQRWLQLAYHDVTWVQRLDDPTSKTGTPASSCIQPSLAARMLAALAANPGDQILEIGAGTGWLTALLSYHCGADNITAIELNPELIHQAQTALTKLGHKPQLICTDGADGFPDHAPYNAILSTAAVSHLPRPWLHQTRSGARIVTPLRSAVAVIEVHSYARATGFFLPERIQILPLRSPKNVTHISSVAETQSNVESTATVAAIRDLRFRTFLEMTHPDLTINDQGLLGDVLVMDRRGASIQASPLGRIRGGQLDILTTISHIHQQWENANCPSLADLLVEIDESGQWLYVHGARSGQRWRIQ